MAPRSPVSPGARSRGTPGGRSERSQREESEYDSEDDEGPTVFGSVLRTVMAGAAVVAIALLAKIERDQRYGAPPPPAYRLPPGAIDVRKSVAGSRGSYKIKDGDCLYRIAVNHGVDPSTLEAMNPELASRPYYLQPGEYVRIP